MGCQTGFEVELRAAGGAAIGTGSGSWSVVGLVALLLHFVGGKSLADSWDSFVQKTAATSATVIAEIAKTAEIIETIDIAGIAPVVRKDCFVVVGWMPYCSLDSNSTTSTS